MTELEEVLVMMFYCIESNDLETNVKLREKALQLLK